MRASVLSRSGDLERIGSGRGGIILLDMLGENSRRDLMGACIQEAPECVLNITAAAMHKKLAIVL